jgi:hypothetical protein
VFETAAGKREVGDAVTDVGADADRRNAPDIS